MAPQVQEIQIDGTDLAGTESPIPPGRLNLPDGTSYRVHCPKDTLPLLLNRIQKRVVEEQDADAQEELVWQILIAAFHPEDAKKLLEDMINPEYPHITMRYLLKLLEKVQSAYKPYLDAHYGEMGMENPLAPEADRKAVRQPADRMTSKRPAAKRAAPAKRAAGRTARSA